MEPLSDQVDESLAQERVLAVLSGFFGGLAVLLAALGQYGLTAYSVARRRPEIAIRIALGASSISVVRLTAFRVLKLVVVGSVAGVIASWWFSRYVETLLFGLEPRDSRTLVGAALVLVAAALIAAVVPAREVLKIQPATGPREA
jgi:ABC-type antimicrobial peptide transport system permease subunit